MQSLLLLFSNAAYMLVLVLVLTPAAVLGMKLAPVSWLSTFPLTVLELSGAVMAIPVSIFISKFGRRRCFLVGGICLSTASILLLISAKYHSFLLFFMAMILLGISGCIAAFYRYAAMEITRSEQLGKITSCFVFIPLVSVLLAKGINHSVNFDDETYFAIFAICCVVSVIALIFIIIFFKDSIQQTASKQYKVAAFIEVLKSKNYLFILTASGTSSALMFLIMHSIPLYMKQGEHSNFEIAEHMNWHLLSMFLPALIVGALIDKAGKQLIGAIGVFLYVVALITIPLDVAPMVPMVLAGVAWCFSFSAISTQIGHLIKHSGDSRLEGANELTLHSFNLTATFSAGLLFALGPQYLITLVGFALIFITFGVYLLSRQPSSAQTKSQPELNN